MAMEMKLNFKQEMRLVPTPMLQQAIKLLQLSRLELVQAVQQEMIENPILEEILEEEEELDQKQENPEDPPSTPSAKRRMTPPPKKKVIPSNMSRTGIIISRTTCHREVLQTTTQKNLP